MDRLLLSPKSENLFYPKFSSPPLPPSSTCLTLPLPFSFPTRSQTFVLFPSQKNIMTKYRLNGSHLTHFSRGSHRITTIFSHPLSPNLIPSLSSLSLSPILSLKQRHPTSTLIYCSDKFTYILINFKVLQSISDKFSVALRF